MDSGNIKTQMDEKNVSQKFSNGLFDVSLAKDFLIRDELLE